LFASVDHARLRVLLARMFKEPPLLDLLGRIIAHNPPGAAAGKGLRTGNLTSQHFANLYLGELDHHLKERERVSLDAQNRRLTPTRFGSVCCTGLIPATHGFHAVMHASRAR
jgi:hypothetical protein